MAVLPHHIAGGLLLGGITVGGYFAVTGLTPPKLDDHLSSLGLEVLSDGWANKETEYLKASADELIASINKESNKETIDNFGDRLRKWCDKYKLKPFLGEDDSNYKKFSRWCTKTEKIQTVLEKRGLKALSTEEKEAKLVIYNGEGNNDKFLNASQEPASPSRGGTPKIETPPAKPAVIKDLDNWCNENQTKTDYKYESDPKVKKVIEWCYKK